MSLMTPPSTLGPASTAATITLDVQGMTCPSCIRHVRGALQGLPGVERVEVDLAAGRVIVAHAAPGASIDALCAALADAGYPARPAAV